MKGSITPKGMNVQEWDGQTLNGTRVGHGERALGR